MRIIHTSDLHIDSPLSSKLPEGKIAERKRELIEGFMRICNEAERLFVSVIIIAGDLFDTSRVSKKTLDTVISIFEQHPGIIFLYLPGNHEKCVLENAGVALPKNLKIFGDDWTYFKADSVVFAGRRELCSSMFSSLKLSEQDTNIVVLHGAVKDKSDSIDGIGLPEAADKNIDYLALGHYHTYSAHKIDRRGTAAYCGTPEGRGFDEVGELGFCLIDTDGGVTHKFIPSAKRRAMIVKLPLDGLTKNYDIIERASEALEGVGAENLVRLCLAGSREAFLTYDTALIERSFADRFYYFEVKDNSRLAIRPEEYRYDKSLRGEFIRLCLADTTTDEALKEKIINCGLSALAGESPN